jgi:hypothetical protein
MTTSTDSDTSSDDTASIYMEAVPRAKKRGYNSDTPENAYKFSTAYLDNMEIIKREREQAKRAKRLEQLKPKPEHEPESEQQRQQQEPIDTNPPPEPPSTIGISRVPSREELNNKISYIDKHRVEPLYFAVDDLVHEVKAISDKQKATEERLKAIEESKK